MTNAILEYCAEGYTEVAPQSLFGEASALCSGHARYMGGYRTVTTEELFGGDAELADVVTAAPMEPALTMDPVYQSLIVITLVAYLYMLLRSWHFIGSIWGGVFSGSSERVMAYIGGELPLQRFKLVASIIGGVVLSLALVKLSDGLIPPSSPIYEMGGEHFAPLVAMLLVVVMLAWFYSLHKILGWVTRSDSASQLSSIGYIDFVRAVVLLYPFVVVWLLTPEGSASWSTTAVVVGAVLLTILYLKDTFLLFLGKNISILYWILYLCTAILLPLTFLAHILPERLS